MRFFKARRTTPLSERLFRVRQTGFLKRNLAEGKKEYVHALNEFNAKNKLLQSLMRERARLLESRSLSSALREKLTHVNNTIAGVQEMVQVSIQTQKRAREMILHAEKELGLRPLRPRAKKAA